jgi:hypothetical protein
MKNYETRCRKSVIGQKLNNMDTDGDGKISSKELVVNLNYSWKEYELARTVLDGNHVPRSRILKSVCVYFLFMFFFMLQTSRQLDNEDIYYFGSNLKEQFMGNEFNVENVPNWAKTFEDVNTVEDAHFWMLGPLLGSVYSPSTFDGRSDWHFSEGKPQGELLGYNKILGGIRISQLRSNTYDCSSSIHSALKDNGNYTFRCFGKKGGTRPGFFDEETENRSDFGSFERFDYESEHVKYPNEPSGMHTFGNGTDASSRGPFRYEGIHIDDDFRAHAHAGATVADRRAQLFSYWFSNSWNAYPSPAYAITLSPTMGLQNATQVIRDLVRSKYIDLYTRAVFVDLNVYSAMLDRVCFCRLVIEMTASGGVVTDNDFEVVRMWEHVTSGLSDGRLWEDDFYTVLRIIVGCFYCYYALQLYKKVRLHGIKYLSQFLAFAQLLNIIFFASSTILNIAAETRFPSEIDLDGTEYLDLYPNVRFKRLAVVISAVNVFLNWFKFIQILSYDPTFAVVNLTLSHSGKGVGGFMVVFFVVFYGFSQTHAMIFQGRLEDFRTTGTAMYTLMRSLLGDFDFEKLRQGHMWMGPALFVLFVVLAVFVVLNMLIAIISDAYDKAKTEVAMMDDVSIFSDIRDFLILQLLNTRCCRAVAWNLMPNLVARAFATTTSVVNSAKDQDQKARTVERVVPLSLPPGALVVYLGHVLPSAMLGITQESADANEVEKEVPKMVMRVRFRPVEPWIEEQPEELKQEPKIKAGKKSKKARPGATTIHPYEDDAEAREARKVSLEARAALKLSGTHIETGGADVLVLDPRGGMPEDKGREREERRNQEEAQLAAREADVRSILLANPTGGEGGQPTPTAAEQGASQRGPTLEPLRDETKAVFVTDPVTGYPVKAPAAPADGPLPAASKPPPKQTAPFNDADIPWYAEGEGPLELLLPGDELVSVDDVNVELLSGSEIQVLLEKGDEEGIPRLLRFKRIELKEWARREEEEKRKKGETGESARRLEAKKQQQQMLALTQEVVALKQLVQLWAPIPPRELQAPQQTARPAGATPAATGAPATGPPPPQPSEAQDGEATVADQTSASKGPVASASSSASVGYALTEIGSDPRAMRAMETAQRALETMQAESSEQAKNLHQMQQTQVGGVGFGVLCPSSIFYTTSQRIVLFHFYSRRRKRGSSC